MFVKLDRFFDGGKSQRLWAHANISGAPSASCQDLNRHSKASPVRRRRSRVALAVLLALLRFHLTESNGDISEPAPLRRSLAAPRGRRCQAGIMPSVKLGNEVRRARTSAPPEPPRAAFAFFCGAARSGGETSGVCFGAAV